MFKYVFIIGVVFILLFNVYVLGVNSSNHTGLPLWIVKNIVLILSFVIALFFFVKRIKCNNTATIKYLKLCFVIYLLMYLNIYFYEYFNIMLEYDDWILKGMPK